MKRSRKSNRVSWAPGVNLCQVKLFLRGDCPSKVGGEHQNTLQEKTSFPLHPNGMRANDLPPGFEGDRYASGLKFGLAKIPRIQWKRPPEFTLSLNWRVAAGEESEEVEAQTLREKRVLEAVYPRISVIPPNPISLDVEVECCDDSRIPVVPLTSADDDDESAQTKTPSSFETQGLPMPPSPSNLGTQYMPDCPSSAAEAPGVSSDMMETALATLTAAMKSEEQGSLVDPDLLFKILSDPEMVEKLIHNQRYRNAAADCNAVSTPGPVSSPMLADRNLNHSAKEFKPTLCKPGSMADSVSVSMPMRVESSAPAPVSSPMPLDRNLNYLSKEFRPTLSKQGSMADSVSVSVPMRVESSAPVPVSSPMPADRNLNYLSKEFRPTLSKQVSMADSVSVSMPMRVESSAPAPVSSPMPADRNLNYLSKEFRPTLSKHGSMADSLSVSMPMKVESSVSGHRAGKGNAYSTMNQVQAAPSMMPVQPAVQTMEANRGKDANYLKNLIREHGRQKEEGKWQNTPQTGSHLNHIQSMSQTGSHLNHNLNHGASKNKFRKQCIFFNSSKGCRQGSNCPYMHDSKSLQWQTGRMLEAPSAKRMKLSGEIAGRI